MPCAGIYGVAIAMPHEQRDSPDGDAEARGSDGEGRRPVYFGRYRGIHQQQGTTFSDAELTAFIRHVRRMKATGVAGLREWPNQASATP